MKGVFAGIAGIMSVLLLCGSTLFVVLYVVMVGGTMVQLPAWAQDDVATWMLSGTETGIGDNSVAPAGVGVGWDGYTNGDANPEGSPLHGKPYLGCLFHDPNYTRHTGIDFPVAEGTSVYSTMPGKVVWAGYNGPWGNLVVVENNGHQTYFAHLSEISVSQGQIIGKGTEVGLSGTTGNSTGPHLHYGVKQRTNGGQVWLNPLSTLENAEYVKVECR